MSYMVYCRKQQATSEAYSKALAASQAAQWQQFVQHLEQLAGSVPDQAASLLGSVAEQVSAEAPADVVGLCGALLEAWRAGRQQAAARAGEEVLHAVLSAVQASQQQSLLFSSRPRHQGL
jgi:predicted LPLAT superfamily acyltransferase